MESQNSSDKHPFEWQIGYDPSELKWVVIGYTGKRHTFEEESDARAFIERDKRMLAEHTKQVNEEMFSSDNSIFGVADEPTADAQGEVEEESTGAGRTFNRAERRRVERLAGRTPSSRRRRK